MLVHAIILTSFWPCYCDQGLSLLLRNQYREALNYFNLARMDKVWGAKSLQKMIFIYLQKGIPTGTGVPAAKVQLILTIAEKLLRELQSLDANQKTTHVIKGYVALNRGENEAALKEFSEVLVSDKECVPALLGLAKTLMATDASFSKARNVAKKIVKIPYKDIYHDEFLMGYLLLAEMYKKKGKFDTALELCRRCLELNKSCEMAWGIIARVMEERRSYEEAASCYEKSWRLSGNRNVIFGYKSALNYYKEKKTVKAIEMCHEMLRELGCHCVELSDLMFQYCVKSIKP